MKLRIKTILQEKGLRMADLAEKLGTDQSNLTKSLKNNPTLGKLQDIAKVLDVEVHELLTDSIPSRPSGVLMVGGRAYAVSEPMSNTVQLPVYSNYSDLKRDIRLFIVDAIKEQKRTSICGMVEAFEVFALMYDPYGERFSLTLCYGKGLCLSFSYDKMEYAEWKEDTAKWMIEDATNNIINDIEDAVLEKISKEE